MTFGSVKYVKTGCNS